MAEDDDGDDGDDDSGDGEAAVAGAAAPPAGFVLGLAELGVVAAGVAPAGALVAPPPELELSAAEAGDPAGCEAGVVGDEVAGFEAVVALASVGSEFCATADGLLAPEPSDGKPWFFHRKYPSPTARASATTIKTNFPAPPLLGSSSSSSK